MKRLLAVVALPLVAVLLLGATTDSGKHKGRQVVFFGFLIGSPRVAGVGIDLAPPDHAGRRVLRAYVCDGLGVSNGQAAGIAVWFTGVLDTTVIPTAPLHFTSVSGQHTLVITALSERGVFGSFVEPDGSRAHFAAYQAFDGAGIYEVTLDQRLRYTGISTDGARLEAQSTPDGTTVGTIKPAQGKAIEFTVRSLALSSVADLAEHGLPDYTPYAAQNQIPGEYVAVIAPGGTHWFGRSGFVKLGSPTLAEIIGLDKKTFFSFSFQ